MTWAGCVPVEYALHADTRQRRSGTMTVELTDRIEMADTGEQSLDELPCSPS
ncbi:MAG TPA: hypothetical protein VFH94_07445 [Streptomyces sp.]|nr:hypothetical protein [Streptomyces sp.]